MGLLQSLVWRTGVLAPLVAQQGCVAIPIPPKRSGVDQPFAPSPKAGTVVVVRPSSLAGMMLDTYVTQGSRTVAVLESGEHRRLPCRSADDEFSVYWRAVDLFVIAAAGYAAYADVPDWGRSKPGRGNTINIERPPGQVLYFRIDSHLASEDTFTLHTVDALDGQKTRGGLPVRGTGSPADGAGP